MAKTTFEVSGVSQEQLSEGETIAFQVSWISESDDGDVTVHLTAAAEGTMMTKARKLLAGRPFEGEDRTLAVTVMALAEQAGRIADNGAQIDDALRNTVGGIGGLTRSEYR